jgi:hypothetical protein
MYCPDVLRLPHFNSLNIFKALVCCVCCFRVRFRSRWKRRVLPAHPHGQQLDSMPGLRSNILRRQCTPCPLIRYLTPLLQVFVLCLHDSSYLRDRCFGLQSEAAVSDCTRVKQLRTTTHDAVAHPVRRWSQLIARCHYLKARIPQKKMLK